MNLFKEHSTNNRFGYYQTGDYKSYSVLDCQQKSTSTGNPVQWIFNDDVYSGYDWTVEPQQDLQELYRQRAQQIRDRYDYVVVWYSGGCDSQNVLDSFLHNGIIPDEVATYVNSEGLSGITPSTPTNSEPLMVVKPMMEKWKKIYPYLQHRWVDMFPMMHDFFNSKKHCADLSYFFNHDGTPHQFIKGILTQYIKDYDALLKQGKSLCFVWGSDKPRVFFNKNKWQFRFYDIVDSTVRPTVQIMDNQEHHELFYWSPDLPELVIKQAHVVMNEVKTVAGAKRFFRQRYVDEVLNECYVSPDQSIDVIYPTWDINTFSIGKSPLGYLHGHRDHWLYRSNVDQHLSNYLNGLNEYTKGMDSFMLKTSADQTNTLLAQQLGQFYSLTGKTDQQFPLAKQWHYSQAYNLA